eukprot:11081772-Prorocentrum_lima.AAC.1
MVSQSLADTIPALAAAVPVLPPGICSPHSPLPPLPPPAEDGASAATPTVPAVEDGPADGCEAEYSSSSDTNST